jgi:hypothetical protein
MPKDLSREEVSLGTIHFQWIIKEYSQYERGRTWYLVVGIIAAILLAYAIITGNNSFAVIIVLFGVILYLQNNQTPLEINVAFADAGVVVGKKFYRYSEFDRFWIVYNPGDIKALYLMVNGTLKNRITVPLQDNDPRPIRRFLSQFILEQTGQEEEPLSDKLTRALKIQ